MSGQYRGLGAPLVAFGVPLFVLEAPERLRCRDAPDAFFVKNPGAAQARALCTGCCYIEACGAYALERPGLVGVWGGTTERERRLLRRRLPA